MKTTTLGSVTGASSTAIQSGTGGINLTGNTSVLGASTLTVGTGTTALGGALNTTGLATFNGNLRISDGSSNFATINVSALDNNYTISVPTVTANDEFCLVNLNNCASQANRLALVVAANNSPAVIKAQADYVATGASDEDTINTALTAAGAGGTVFLAEGTFIVDGTILIPNNVTLAGGGSGTIIELADIDITDNVIENSDTVTGTGIVIRDLMINGRKDLNTAGTQNGIYLSGMGAGVVGKAP